MLVKIKAVPPIILFADRKIPRKDKCFDLLVGKSQYIFKSMIYKWYRYSEDANTCYLTKRRSFNIDWKDNVHYLSYVLLFFSRTMQHTNCLFNHADYRSTISFIPARIPPIQPGLCSYGIRSVSQLEA